MRRNQSDIIVMSLRPSKNKHIRLHWLGESVEIFWENYTPLTKSASFTETLWFWRKSSTFFNTFLSIESKSSTVHCGGEIETKNSLDFLFCIEIVALKRNVKNNEQTERRKKRGANQRTNRWLWMNRFILQSVYLCAARWSETWDSRVCRFMVETLKLYKRIPLSTITKLLPAMTTVNTTTTAKIQY